MLGEFGGLGLPVTGHTWQDEKNWGYRSFTNARGADRRLPRPDQQAASADRRRRACRAAVYTQTTDVEIEVNGLMTYDRALVKMDLRKLADANHGPR